jgi:hypothetical protein
MVAEMLEPQAAQQEKDPHSSDEISGRYLRFPVLSFCFAFLEEKHVDAYQTAAMASQLVSGEEGGLAGDVGPIAVKLTTRMVAETLDPQATEKGKIF